MMIDWATVTFSFPHSTPLNDGNVLSIDSDGTVQWCVEKRKTIRSSYESTIQLQSIHDSDQCSHIRFDGNPVKFLQGHNVFGSSDLFGLLVSCLEPVLSNLLSSEVEQLRLLPVHLFNASVSRLDLTNMYDLGNIDRVRFWLQSAEYSANLRHRGKGQFTKGTLYFGKHSKRWATKMYAKGDEISKHAPLFSGDLLPDVVTDLKEYANRSLRIEHVLRRPELEKLGLMRVSSCDESLLETVYSSYLSKFEFSQNMKASVEIQDLEKLPPRLRAFVVSWYEGHDVKSFCSRATWHRYRNEIMKHMNLDIALPSPVQLPEPSNVIPLFTVLEAKPMDIPDWAKGTRLFFEPPKLKFRHLKAV